MERINRYDYQPQVANDAFKGATAVLTAAGKRATPNEKNTLSTGDTVTLSEEALQLAAEAEQKAQQLAAAEPQNAREGIGGALKYFEGKIDTDNISVEEFLRNVMDRYKEESDEAAQKSAERETANKKRAVSKERKETEQASASERTDVEAPVIAQTRVDAVLAGNGEVAGMDERALVDPIMREVQSQGREAQPAQRSSITETKGKMSTTVVPTSGSMAGGISARV